MGAWSNLQLLAMAATFTWFAFRTRGAPLSRLRLCLLFAFAGAAVGAVALGVLLRLPAWALSGFRRSLFAHGDIMAYGALFGLSITFAALARRRGVEPLAALDRLAPALGVLVCFARIGCFLAGCDFGSVAEVPWAVHYPKGTAAFRQQLDAGWIHASDVATLPVHPSQLYEAGVGILMAAVGLAVERRQRGADRRAEGGEVFAAVAVTYAIGRFIVEGSRGDERGSLGPLSTPQWISFTLVVYVALQIWARKTEAVR